MPATAQKVRQAESQTSVPRKAPWYGRPFVWSLLIFAALNLLLWRQAGHEKQSSDLWSGGGSIDLALNDFQKLSKTPNVVLLGSSLMMFPFWSMDCEKDRSVGDIFHHHGSKALETALNANGYANPHVFSFAIFGQMVSDAYIYVDEFLKGEKAPQFVIYGIAPRDFSDNDLPNPMATNSFKRLVTLNNFSHYADLYLPGFQDRIEFVMSHACYFYNKRWRLQQELNKGIAKAYAFLGLAQENKTASANNKKSGFMLYGSTEERWESSKQEYARRYRNIAERDLSVQMGFLYKLLDTCAERKIKVIVVNMPLSDVNRNLLPSGFYSRFRAEIAKAANRPDVRFLDIGASADFTHLDFWDTAHLEQSGGHKIVSKVVPLMLNMQAPLMVRDR
ncbi:MAG: DUF1574 domain-containing protein [Candidatus Obscuribacterales bacterium]|nr:DUF1574 domain-containing protein [Candidatus Obscuribacterales bacterium]